MKRPQISLVLVLGGFLLCVLRWWARQVVKNIPPSDMLEVRAKVAALTALRGERKDWGVSRAWERDYLANVSGLHTISSV